MRGLFCTYEKTAVAIEYFEIVGLEEVEVFLPLTRLPISEYAEYSCYIQSSSNLYNKAIDKSDIGKLVTR